MTRRVLLLALAPLTACSVAPPEGATPPPDGYGGGQCDPRPAAALIGQQASTDTGAQALRLTGARTLRWGPPRSAFTMDFSPMRVNVMYDDAMTITEVTCG
jgi:hypothetical protein